MVFYKKHGQDIFDKHEIETFSLKIIGNILENPELLEEKNDA